jgi:hypothetical protein
MTIGDGVVQTGAVQAAPLRLVRAPVAAGAQPWYRGRSAERIVALLAPVAFVLLWEALVRIGLLDARFFPAPS